MEKNVLQIKNVVCQRCKDSVREILYFLHIPYKEILLGEVVLEKELEPQEVKKLQKEFDRVGFEILIDKNEKIVNKIKSTIIANVYEDQLPVQKKLPDILGSHLPYDYSYLSATFSKVEGVSIAKFHSNSRIERVKELLEYGELNIKEIAERLHYKSANYLCTKFKKETGFSPLAYQKAHLKKRVGLDSL